MTIYTASNRTNGNTYSVVSISADGTFKLQAAGRKPFSVKFDAFAERYDLIGEEGKPVSIDDTVQRVADEEAANAAIVAQAEAELKEQEVAPETEKQEEKSANREEKKAHHAEVVLDNLTAFAQALTSAGVAYNVAKTKNNVNFLGNVAAISAKGARVFLKQAMADLLGEDPIMLNADRNRKGVHAVAISIVPDQFTVFANAVQTVASKPSTEAAAK